MGRNRQKLGTATHSRRESDECDQSGRPGPIRAPRTSRDRQQRLRKLRLAFGQPAAKRGDAKGPGQAGASLETGGRRTADLRTQIPRSVASSMPAGHRTLRLESPRRRGIGGSLSVAHSRRTRRANPCLPDIAARRQGRFDAQVRRPSWSASRANAGNRPSSRLRQGPGQAGAPGSMASSARARAASRVVWAVVPDDDARRLTGACTARSQISQSAMTRSAM